MRIRRRPSSLAPPPSSAAILPNPPYLARSSQDATPPPPPLAIAAVFTNPQEKGTSHQDVDLHSNSHLRRDRSPNTTCSAPPPPNPTLVKEGKEAIGMAAVVDSSKIALANSAKMFAKRSVGVGAAALLAADGGKKRKGTNGVVDEAMLHAKVYDSASCTDDHIGGATVASETEAAMAKEKDAANARGGRRRGSTQVVMTGSRCSRVNGRGWRCSQPTLVGYALCEHHLGKGRLRSVSNARGQLGATTKSKRVRSKTPSAPAISETASHKLIASSLQEAVIEAKRTRKGGMVRARSMSSLLDGADHVPMSSPVPPKPASQLEAASLAASPPPAMLVGSNNVAA